MVIDIRSRAADIKSQSNNFSSGSEIVSSSRYCDADSIQSKVTGATGGGSGCSGIITRCGGGKGGGWGIRLCLLCWNMQLAVTDTNLKNTIQSSMTLTWIVARNGPKGNGKQPVPFQKLEMVFSWILGHCSAWMPMRLRASRRMDSLSHYQVEVQIQHT